MARVAKKPKKGSIPAKKANTRDRSSGTSSQSDPMEKPRECPTSRRRRSSMHRVPSPSPERPRRTRRGSRFPSYLNSTCSFSRNSTRSERRQKEDIKKEKARERHERSLGTACRRLLEQARSEIGTPESKSFIEKLRNLRNFPFEGVHPAS